MPTQPPRRPPSTIHDVARHAGVSSMTVSRVVNDSTKVGAELKNRVLEAIRELEYVPNLAARAARSGTVRIGIVISNPASSNVGGFLLGAFGESARNGCQILLEPIGAATSGLDALRKLVVAQVDGVVIPPPLCDSITVFEFLRREGIPALSFATAEARPYASAVLIDNFEGARRMTDHLIGLGHKRIAFVRGDPTHSPTLYREEGFRMAMAAAGLEVRAPWVVAGDFSYRSGLEAGRTLLESDDRPTAIFTSNDDMAAGVLAVAHGLDLKVPADISIAGFDDTPIATIVWPQLTTVNQPIAAMASAAVADIVEVIRRRRNGDDAAVIHHRIDYHLVERGSTGAPRHPK